MLKISGLSKTYANGVRALRQVALEIPQGMFGLLGPNGAGKSTLMRTIATLQEADEGTIHFGDIDALKEKNEIRKTVTIRHDCHDHAGCFGCRLCSRSTSRDPTTRAASAD